LPPATPPEVWSLGLVAPRLREFVRSVAWADARSTTGFLSRRGSRFGLYFAATDRLPRAPLGSTCSRLYATRLHHQRPDIDERCCRTICRFFSVSKSSRTRRQPVRRPTCSEHPDAGLVQISQHDAILKKMGRRTADRIRQFPEEDEYEKVQRDRQPPPPTVEKSRRTKTDPQSSAELLTRVRTWWSLKSATVMKKISVSSKEKAQAWFARVIRVLNRPGTDRNRISQEHFWQDRLCVLHRSRTQSSKVVRRGASGQRTVAGL